MRKGYSDSCAMVAEWAAVNGLLCHREHDESAFGDAEFLNVTVDPKPRPTDGTVFAKQTVMSVRPDGTVWGWTGFMFEEIDPDRLGFCSVGVVWKTVEGNEWRDGL